MENTHIVIMTTAVAKPGKEKIVQQALRDVAAAARAQPDCIGYNTFCSTDNPAVTIAFERWGSEEERDLFLAGGDVKEFASAVSGAFVESPQPKSFEVLEEA